MTLHLRAIYLCICGLLDREPALQRKLCPHVPSSFSSCPSVCLTVCLSDCLSVCLSVFLTLCLYLSVYLWFIRPGTCSTKKTSSTRAVQFFFLSICLSVWLSVYLSVCLSVFLTLCLSVYLCICGLLDREPALQRKLRPHAPSTKSQIFIPASSSTSTKSGLSTAAVHPTSSTSVTSSPAGVAQSRGSVSSSPAGVAQSRGYHNEYMLLGDQSKFASNVVYHVRPRASEHIRPRTSEQVWFRSSSSSSSCKFNKITAKPLLNEI